MRLLLLFLAFPLLASAAVASDLAIVRTWPGYRTEESFMRVSEYFTGRENTGGQTYLRSKPEQRAGYYFLVRVKNSGERHEAARLELQVITPHSPAPATYSYTVEVPRGRHVYQIGLTGSDWPNVEEAPVAWHIAVFDSQGNPLVTDQSYLWSKPDTP